MTLTPDERNAAREWAYEFGRPDSRLQNVALFLRELLRETEDQAREIERLREALMAEAFKA